MVNDLNLDLVHEINLEEDRFEIKCWKCGKTGHLKKDCRNRSVVLEKRDEAPSSSVKQDDESNA